MKSLWKTMLQGLAAVLPALVTLYVIYWIVSTMELLIGGFLKFFFLGSIYFPGMGILVGIILLYLAGVMLERVGIIQKIYAYAEGLFEKIPFVKSLYSSLKDLMQFFSTAKQGEKEHHKVVLLNINNMRLIGLVTGKVAEQLSRSIEEEETIPVYLPMSYQLGGFTVYVAPSQVKDTDLSVEEAMKIALTGGVGKTD